MRGRRHQSAVQREEKSIQGQSFRLMLDRLRFAGFLQLVIRRPRISWSLRDRQSPTATFGDGVDA